MSIRIKWDNGLKSRWLGIGKNFTLENLNAIIWLFEKVLNCQGVNYQLEYKN